MGPRQQGDLGELSAMEWFGRQGATIFVPVTHSPDVDLIVIREGRMERVQVKTSRAARNGRYEVSICTRGGNQSWSGITTRFAPSRCDLVFILVADGRRWCIPAGHIPGSTKLNVGGPQYARFEVEPGLPFEVTRAA